MRLLLVCFFLSISFWSLGQDSTATDTIKFEPTKRVFQPGLYLDYGKLFQSVSTDYSKVEGGIEIVLGGKWQLIGEGGQWKLSPAEIIENGEYHLDGIYYRLGIGFIPFVDSESRVGIGFRIAHADFSERGNYQFEPTSGIQENVTETFRRAELSADWYELVFYSDKKLNKRVTLGFTARLRVLLNRSIFDPIDTQIIPGYGNPAGKRVGAVNLFLKIPL